MKIAAHWPEVTKHLIALILGWGLFSILLGLFFAFDSMEASKEAIMHQAIPAFLLVSVISFLIGSIVISLPLLIWKILNGNSINNK